MLIVMNRDCRECVLFQKSTKRCKRTNMQLHDSVIVSGDCDYFVKITMIVI